MTPNITIALKGKDLVITVKNATDTKGVPSQSGKNLLVASTKGNMDISSYVGPGAKLGLNIYRPAV